MGIDCFDKIVQLSDRKVLIYHNITPERFFSDDGTKKYIRLGLHQVQEYKQYMNYQLRQKEENSIIIFKKYSFKIIKFY